MGAGQVKVIGCGNLFFGDDGFGPAVISFLTENSPARSGIELIDAGTAAGGILLDVFFDEAILKAIIIIDAMDLGLSPGVVKVIPMESIPSIKRDDFSVHQFPSLDILSELKRKGTKVRIVGCQAEVIPDQVCPGLSDAVAAAVPQAALLINNILDNLIF